MNKSDLVRTLAKMTDLTDAKAQDVVDIVFGGFSRALANGDRVEIRGFGIFSAREYKAHAGRNPRTGGVIEVGTKRLPHFKVGKELQKKLNSG
ncbi:MAG TPA: HU family DNA-binding protein [Syntrophales bacterium]|nr:HU family DNA-binding protein [Syntrophales bacterium]